MAPIEFLAGAVAIPALWAAVHLVLGLRELKLVQAFEKLSRPTQLAVAFAGSILFIVTANWLLGSPLNERLRFVFDNYGSDKLERQHVQFWSSLTYSLTFIIGLPVAFLLWHWRDANVVAQIENARKDTNLTEFQEVQLRAAGALDDKLPTEAREQLQIAALHQLRGFLRGEYGKSFKRPAFELLLAGHAAAIHRIGVPEVQNQLTGKTLEEIEAAVAALRAGLTPIDRTRILIIRDEAEHIFRAEFPLDGRRFDLLDLTRKDLRPGGDFSSSHFFGAKLWAAHLEGAELWDAHLEGAELYAAHLEGANLKYAHLEGANLSWAQFNDATRLIGDWDSLTPEQRAEHQQKLRDLGARHVDDP